MFATLSLGIVVAGGFAPKEVNLYIGQNVAPAPKIRIYINTKNVRQVPLQIYKLPVSDLRFLFDPAKPKPKVSGAPFRTLKLDVAGQKKTLALPQDTYYEKQFSIPDLAPGYYLIQSPGFAGTSWATLNITNLSVIVKRGDRHALTWVTDAKTGKVVPGAQVSAFRKGQSTLTSTTDANGTSNMSIPPGEDVVLVQRGKDAAAVSVMGSNRDGTPISHMQFDRPIYRPGQQGSFKAILRRVKGIAYEPIANAPVTMDLFDPQMTLIERHDLKTTAIGTVAGSFDLPKEGSLGNYSVYIRKGDELLALQSMQVAEYRKPEFKATSTFSQKRYLVGDKIQTKLSTEYYFGAKVPNAQVQVTVRRSPMRWGYDSFQISDGNLYDQATYQAGQVVANDIRQTEADGTLNVEIPTVVDASDSTYSFSYTITDSANRRIEHSNSVAVYAAALKVSIGSSVGYVPLGRLVPMEIRLSDLDGGNIGGKVDVELRRTVWNEKEKRNVEETLEKTIVTVPASGKMTVSLPAKASGYLSMLATAKDTAGRKTTSRNQIYITDPFTAPDDQSKQPAINIRLERRQYSLGETVNGFVESNKPKRPILLTMEGTDLLYYMVLSKPGAFSFKLTPATSPNMVFDANQWVNGGRLSDNAMIAVTDPSRRIAVTVKPERDELAPGDRAKYSITTKDAKGQPISSEVGFQVVDEAIYAIQPDNTRDLIDTFWGYRANGVVTSASAPEDLSGGAYQAMAPGVGKKDAPMRTQFVDTAYWNPFVQTGPNGQANVEFDMPGNLTAWRANARAVTLTTQVGQGMAMTRSSRPLTLRLATPRQMVVGDELKVIGTVTNRSPKDERVRVRIQVGDEVKDETVTVAAGGETKVAIPVAPKQLNSLTVRGEIFDENGTRLDGLEQGVPVNPNGVPFRQVVAGRAGGENLTFSLPSDSINGSSKVKIRFYAGSASMLPVLEDDLLKTGRYSPMIAADQVETASRLGLPWTDDRIREPIAMLGRTRQSAGWGWWDEGTPDPVVTARVLRGLWATSGKYPEWESLRNQARAAAEFQYKNVQFAEYRAHIVEALAIAGSGEAKRWTIEVDESKTPISPTAQLALVNALNLTGEPARAKARLDRLLVLVSKGTSSYLPVGQGTGWTGTQLEANARLLQLLLKASPNDEVVDGLADWVIDKSSGYMGPSDAGAVLRALHDYAKAKPSPAKVGILKVFADGVEVPVKRQPEGLWAEAELPADAAGKSIRVQGVDPKEPLRYTIETKSYREASDEATAGVRTMLRWEAQNEAGAWQELDRPIRPNEPIRVSTVVWSDAVTDAVRVVIPIPAGFEYIDQDRLSYGRQEVRDGAVIYYSVLANGIPATYRFYLRAETGGSISVPPAMAEALRRPEVRGNSNALKVTVTDK